MSEQTVDLEPSAETRMDRRAYIGASVLVAAVAASGCTPVAERVLPLHRTTPPSEPLPVTGSGELAVRLLNRAGFGPTEGEAARVAQMGATAYVEEQLNAPIGEEDAPLALRVRLSALPALQFSPHDLGEYPVNDILRQLEQAALLRAVYSPWQLRERMADFWGNHFNIFARKGFAMFFKGADDANVIRKHALGTFPELLRASARSPAMLGYLDNQQNRKGVANENYARELMELHTLGVHGGYTQKDVQEVARCLTGWTIEDRFLRPRGTFRFDPDLHDSGAKTVLGTTMAAGGGEDDGERVLALLATHPSTARFISTKLVRYFHGSEDPSLVDSTAQVFLSTNGDIKAILRHLLLSPQLADAPPILKRPFDFIVSALRAANAESDGGKPLQEHLAHMGQPLNEWPMPDGYPDKTASWTGSVLARWNFALAFAGNAIAGTSARWEGNLMERLLARRASEPGMAELKAALHSHEHAPAEYAALVLSSPAFQWR